MRRPGGGGASENHHQWRRTFVAAKLFRGVKTRRIRFAATILVAPSRCTPQSLAVSRSLDWVAVCR